MSIPPSVSDEEADDVFAVPSVVLETTLPCESVTVMVMVPSLFTVSVVVFEEDEEEPEADEADEEEFVPNRLDTADVPDREEMEPDIGCSPLSFGRPTVGSGRLTGRESHGNEEKRLRL